MANITKASFYTNQEETSVIVELDNNVCKELYLFPSVELPFSEIDFIGLNEFHAIELMIKKEIDAII